MDQYTFGWIDGKYGTMDRSKLTIVALFAIGALFGTYSVWFHFQQGHRCLEFWGKTAGNDIQHAPRVEAIFLAEDSPPSNESTDGGEISEKKEPITIDNQTFVVTKRLEITSKSGIIHARHALIMDSSFEWQGTRDAVPRWRMLLAFSGRGQETLVAVDLDQRLLGCVSTAASSPSESPAHSRSKVTSTAVLTAPAAKAIATFLERAQAGPAN